MLFSCNLVEKSSPTSAEELVKKHNQSNSQYAGRSVSEIDAFISSEWNSTADTAYNIADAIYLVEASLNKEYADISKMREHQSAITKEYSLALNANNQIGDEELSDFQANADSWIRLVNSQYGRASNLLAVDIALDEIGLGTVSFKVTQVIRYGEELISLSILDGLTSRRRPNDTYNSDDNWYAGQFNDDERKCKPDSDPCEFLNDEKGVANKIIEGRINTGLFVPVFGYYVDIESIDVGPSTQFGYEFDDCDGNFRRTVNYLWALPDNSPIVPFGECKECLSPEEMKAYTNGTYDLGDIVSCFFENNDKTWFSIVVNARGVNNYKDFHIPTYFYGKRIENAAIDILSEI